ncbi:MAG TPA: NAD(P)H-dependent oxidoreductase [Oculatellaceae cyanobacterium]
MSTLLHIDSSPMGDASISRRLTKEFVEAWKTNHPGSNVIYRDLYKTDLSPVTADWVTAAYTPGDVQTPEQKAILKLSNTLCDEIAQADEWILGVPMHNFTIPTVLSLWIGMLARVGKTFSYENGVPAGMLKNKKVHLIVSSGGVYDSGPAVGMDFVVPYLKAIFGFLGLSDVTAHYAGGTSAVRNGKIDAETYLKPHIDSVKQEAKEAALV